MLSYHSTVARTSGTWIMGTTFLVILVVSLRRIVSHKGTKLKTKGTKKSLCELKLFTFVPLCETLVLEFASDDAHRIPAPRFTRCISRNHDCRDGPGQQPRLVGTHLLAARTCSLERLDANRPRLPILPVHRRRLDRTRTQQPARTRRPHSRHLPEDHQAHFDHLRNRPVS